MVLAILKKLKKPFAICPPCELNLLLVTQMHSKALLSTREIAMRLSVNRQTAARYCRTGQLSPSLLIGGEFRVTESTLERFIASKSYVPPESLRKGTPLSADDTLDVFNQALQAQNK